MRPGKILARRVSRRDFLRSSVAVSAAVIASRWAYASPPPTATPAEGVGVLVDVTRCIGCRACVRACNVRNRLPQADTATTVWDGTRDELRYDHWTAVNAVGGAERPPVSVKRQCMHCLEPACVSVCPVGAMAQQASGAVIYRAERCVGCRYCLLACPFSVPKFQWDSGVAPVVGKCQFCAQHADASGPACVAACPTGALKFGKREEMLAEARFRVHARPDRYHPQIYGEREAGGTAWLYLADRPAEQLGLPQGLPTVPLPSLTKMAMQVLPGVVAVMTVALGLVSKLARTRARGGQVADA